MRLLLNYKGINKFLLHPGSYSDVVKFIEQNFLISQSQWTLHYIDADYDEISLDSQIDFEAMLETVGKNHLKVYIIDKKVPQKDSTEEKIGTPSQAVFSPYEERKI